jgi:hypothetical protein
LASELLSVDESRPWAKEVIPNEDLLFMRAHKSYFRNGDLMPGVFRDVNGGMSLNWKRYCGSPEEARAKASKNPEANAIIGLIAKDIRNTELVLEHTPDEFLNDRSHSDALGEKTTEIRTQLMKVLSWQIRLDLQSK